ncbi:MAG: radical SAM protein [Candidatus Omnitrophota bacterium]
MDITLNIQCNNDCLFCPRKEFLSIISCNSLKQIYRSINETRKTSDKIVLSGGEVTLLPELITIVKHCKTAGFRAIGIITNARLLRNPGFTRELVLAGANEFAVSLYSIRDMTHDRITQKPGSCRETKEGLRNLIALSKRFNISIRINTVLSALNCQDLKMTILSLYKAGIRDFIIAEEIITKNGNKHLDLPEIKDFFSRIRKLNAPRSHVVFRGFAPCLTLPKKKTGGNRLFNDAVPVFIREPHTIDTLTKTSTKKSLYLRKFKGLFSKKPFCADCRFARSCGGLQKKYFTDKFPARRVINLNMP